MPAGIASFAIFQTRFVAIRVYLNRKSACVRLFIFGL
ncbi:hypothetical protein W822_16950 [Advenella kashmirensis W13003]|uniref:Uncharacterized protein n=1 Tax=Advenella kashmirensis W13003 TaxID=1424334 RepID=V8QPW4_9BURK|nr:hypothetical protein W822_16950 [Advenella kashmirensis W13003]